MYLQGIADFFDDILGGLSLISSSLIVGSLLWRLVVLDSRLSMPGSIIRRSIWGIGAGAVILAMATALGLLVKCWALTAMLGGFKFAVYAQTIQFKASLLRFLLALALVGTAYRLLQTPLRQSVWILASILILALTVNGAWLVHAVGRLENRAWLMTITILHQLAAGAWIGGVFQLLLLRALGRHDGAARAFWPQALTRFARLGIPAVLILIVNGLLLARNYVGSWVGLVGTAYGSLVIIKVILFGCALGFALLNNRAARRWPRTDDIERKVPYYIEVEFLLLVTILFIAAGLSSQPPAADIPRDTATLSEVAAMFSPRMPRLASPSHAEFKAGEAGRNSFENNAQSLAATAWSDYNHNVCGLFLAAMAIAALLSYHPRLHWARYWPLGFAALGLFLFFRNDPQAWPLGPMGFWESTLGDGEVMQHRVFTVSTFAMGAVEFRARRGKGSVMLPYVFPVLVWFGAIILLAHGHAGFELKSEYLIKATHNVIGVLAIIMACGRWLEIRLGHAGHEAEGRMAGMACYLAMLGAAFILMFYREPL